MPASSSASPVIERPVSRPRQNEPLQVDHERPERELAAGAELDERVELEARERADAAEQRRAEPDERRSPRATRRVSAVARYTPTRPAARLAAR